MQAASCRSRRESASAAADAASRASHRYFVFLAVFGLLFGAAGFAFGADFDFGGASIERPVYTTGT